MKRIVGMAAKLAVVAAVIYGLYAVSQLNQRSVTAWTADSPADVGKPVLRGRSSSSISEQRHAAACATQTWPNIKPECMTGQAQPARRDMVSAASAEQAAPLAAPAPHPQNDPAPHAKRDLIDPPHTGSLPTPVDGRLDRPSQARAAAAATRETPRRVKLRNAHHAARPARNARWAARPRRQVYYGERYAPRTAYLRWWNPNQYWRDGRPE